MGVAMDNSLYFLVCGFAQQLSDLSIRAFDKEVWGGGVTNHAGAHEAPYCITIMKSRIGYYASERYALQVMIIGNCLCCRIGNLVSEFDRFWPRASANLAHQTSFEAPLSDPTFNFDGFLIMVVEHYYTHCMEMTDGQDQ